MVLPDNPLVNSTLGLINGDLFSQKLKTSDHLEWSADSSLTLATLVSLSKGYNLTDIMDQFEKWFETGVYTFEDQPQPVGDITRKALEKYQQTHDPFTSGSLDEADNGNGALIRITPVVMFLQSQYGADFVLDDPAMLILHQVGGLTHNHPRGLIALGVYAMILNRLLTGISLSEALEAAIDMAYEYYAGAKIFVEELKAFERLNTPDFKNMPLEEVIASGYVIDTLESVVWVLLNSTSYRDALELAARVKGDPSRIITLVGAVAGIIYGHTQLPKSWLNDREYLQIKHILETTVMSGKFDFKK